jgi:rubrerythrin
MALGSVFFFFLIAAGAAPATWGAKAAALDLDRSIGEMLNYAIEDEYLARAEYDSIIKKFGDIRPFSNIIKAEENHIAWLRDAFAAANLALPKDEAASLFKIPDTIKEALQVGVQAEIDNIAMYDSFLASPLMARSENASLKALFIRLRDASKNHLAAFKNGLAKY